MIKEYVPEFDIFFLEEQDLLEFEGNLQDVFVMPRGEFFNHSSYGQIQLVNSFLYWQISRNAQYVIIAHPDWITSLTDGTRNELFKVQVKMKRGLIFPFSLFQNETKIPTDYIVEIDNEKFVIIQKAMWDQLPFKYKEVFLKIYALEWDNCKGQKVPENIPAHLIRYANRYPEKSGSNCLAATLFAITGHDWMVHEWVHPETFVQGLKNARYNLIDSEIRPGDIVTWESTEGMIQHATYHISSNLFFNKNGQTFFNPWKIVHKDELYESWKKYKIKVYRKQDG
ncbi:hypothetical protein IM538_08900 [Cytobacillus suaedae]|nr:hypothetical protein IM538_08900 [Cytobacillus suaedae]